MKIKLHNALCKRSQSDFVFNDLLYGAAKSNRIFVYDKKYCHYFLHLEAKLDTYFRPIFILKNLFKEYDVYHPRYPMRLHECEYLKRNWKEIK